MLLTGLPVGNGAPAVFDADFLENIFEMKFDRVQTDFEDNRDFPVRFACRHPAENFFFPFAEQGGGLDRPDRAPGRFAAHIT